MNERRKSENEQNIYDIAPDDVADRKDTASSGALVPNATTVSPMTSGEIPHFPAAPALPSTNQSAPFTRSAKPRTRRNICNASSIPETILSARKKTRGNLFLPKVLSFIRYEPPRHEVSLGVCCRARLGLLPPDREILPFPRKIVKRESNKNVFLSRASSSEHAFD